MNISIELDGEQISNIVFADLQETREQFLEDLEGGHIGIFSCNEAYDKALIIKHIEALDLILEWYRDPSA